MPLLLNETWKAECVLQRKAWSFLTVDVKKCATILRAYLNGVLAVLIISLFYHVGGNFCLSSSSNCNVSQYGIRKNKRKKCSDIIRF